MIRPSGNTSKPLFHGNARRPPAQAAAALALITGAVLAAASPPAPAATPQPPAGPIANAAPQAGGASASATSTMGQPGAEGTAQVSGVPVAAHLATTSGGAVQLSVRSVGLMGHRLGFTGHITAVHSPQTVTIERLDAPGGVWTVLASAPVGAHGSFTVRWDATIPGRLTIRAQLGPAPGGGAASALEQSQSSEPLQVTIYRTAVATYFGPGLYGERTACGQRLTRHLVGVASRTLPCGTLVQLSYRGATLVVPVVDRGPYRHGVTWDLTSRAAQLLGAEGMEQIGSLVVGAAPNTPLLGSVPGGGGDGQAGGSPAPAGS